MPQNVLILDNINFKSVLKIQVLQTRASLISLKRDRCRLDGPFSSVRPCGVQQSRCRLRLWWMNTLFSEAIHHTAGSVVVQHLVSRLFLCSKHRPWKNVCSPAESEASHSGGVPTIPHMIILYYRIHFFFMFPESESVILYSS